MCQAYSSSARFLFSGEQRGHPYHIDIHKQIWQVYGMPRKARIDAPGALHHIIVRGIERKAIHLNPIRAGIVRDLEGLKSYRYCGHSVIMGRHQHQWQDIDYVLSLFGQNYGNARRSYSQFVGKALSMGRRPDLVGGGLLRSMGGWSVLKGLRGTGIKIKGDERILGSSDFVEQVLKKANEQLDQKSRLQANGVDLNDLIEKVAGYFDIESEDLKTASKESTVTLARRMLCYLAVRKLMLSCTEVARQLNISPTAVSRAATIGRRLPDRPIIQKQLLDI